MHEELSNLFNEIWLLDLLDKYHDDKQIICSFYIDSKIHILKTNLKTVNILSSHTDEIAMLKVNGNKIISRCYSGDTKIWDLYTGKCLNTFFCDVIDDLFVVYDNKIVALCLLNTIKIWDINTSAKLLETYVNKNRRFKSLQIYKDKIIMNDITAITILNFHTGVVTDILKHVCKSIFKVIIHEDKIISISIDGSIKVWNFHNMSFMGNYYGCYSHIHLTKIYNNIIAIINENNLIYIYDLSTSKQIRIIRCQTFITDIQLYNNTLITMEINNHIAIWNIQTGVCLLDSFGTQSKLHIHDNKLIQLTDNVMSILNLTTRESLNMIAGSCQIKLLQFYENKIILGDQNELKTFDLNTGQLLNIEFFKKEVKDLILIKL